ncbi:MAG: hypothetical protein Q8P31_00785 [Bacillota bacterium]|nr:hypothetical protein [Bacillota bacterium]
MPRRVSLLRAAIPFLVFSLFAPLSVSAASAVTEARIYGPPDVCVGTDASFIIHHPGLSNVQIFIRNGADNAIVAAESDLIKAGHSWSTMRVPGNLFTKPGVIELVMVATDEQQEKSERARFNVSVRAVSDSAALGDSQLEGTQALLLSTRWFYDLDYNGGYMNGVNLSNIASQVKSPIRSGSTELWPQINFSHNIPATDSTSSAVQPHRGLDIAICP